MASFVARGFLRFDGLVPAELNEAFIGTLPPFELDATDAGLAHYGRVMESGAIPAIKPGTPLWETYPAGSALRAILDLPRLRGAIASLVGPKPVFDHHFLHMTFPPAPENQKGRRSVAQTTHQDSTIDPRRAFDIQILYFPRAVAADMGGTRFIPGSHLRIVSESSIGRYQNLRGQEHVVCPEGTVLLFHHGLWHGAGANHSTDLRLMFKIRTAPTQPQHRLWDTSDLPANHKEPRPIFWAGGDTPVDPIHQILATLEPWFEGDTGRLEIMNRLRLWRYLLGDENFDADYWLTRVENEYS